MVSSQTTNARDKKQAEQKRLIQEIENQIGVKGDHPEDELTLDTRYSCSSLLISDDGTEG